MRDDITKDGTTLIGDAEVGTVLYWRTLVEEFGLVVPERCISVSEVFVERIAALPPRPYGRPTFSLVTDIGATRRRWGRLFKLGPPSNSAHEPAR